MLMDNKSTSTLINIDNQWSSIYIFIVSNYGYPLPNIDEILVSVA